MLADRRCCPLTFLSIAHTPTLIFLAPCLQSGACTQHSIARLHKGRGQHGSTLWRAALRGQAGVHTAQALPLTDRVRFMCRRLARPFGAV